MTHPDTIPAMQMQTCMIFAQILLTRSQGFSQQPPTPPTKACVMMKVKDGARRGRPERFLKSPEKYSEANLLTSNLLYDDRVKRGIHSSVRLRQRASTNTYPFCQVTFLKKGAPKIASSVEQNRTDRLEIKEMLIKSKNTKKILCSRTQMLTQGEIPKTSVSKLT